MKLRVGRQNLPEPKFHLPRFLFRRTVQWDELYQIVKYTSQLTFCSSGAVHLPCNDCAGRSGKVVAKTFGIDTLLLFLHSESNNTLKWNKLYFTIIIGHLSHFMLRK